MSRCAHALTLPLSEVPHDYIGDEFFDTAIGFAVAQFILVALRYYARGLRKTPWGPDDFLLPFAALFSHGNQIISMLMVKIGGVGHRVEYNCVHQPDVLPRFAKLQISNIVVLSIAIALSKITILSMFLRIFPQKPYRYATYLIMALQVGLMSMMVTLAFAQCTPTAFIWEPQKHPHGHCIDKNAFWRWGNFPQILTDVAILILPLPALWNLKLSSRDKMGVIVTFCTGGIGLITSIVRFAMFFAIDGQTDSGWNAVPLGCITIAETSVYVFAACLPSYRAFFTIAKGRYGTSAGSSRGKPGLYNSSKSMELKSIDKSKFSRLTHDEKNAGLHVHTRGSGASEEELVPSPGGPRSIQIHTSLKPTNEPR